MGRLELHPGLRSEIGVDSNVFLEDQDPDASAILRLTGHLALSTLGPQRTTGEGETEASTTQHRRVAFRANLEGSLYHYFQARVATNAAANAGFDLTFNPDGRFRFRLYDELTRNVRPFTDATGASRISFGRNDNTAGAELQLRSASGVLRGSFGYEFGASFFDDINFRPNNSQRHAFRGAMGWSFFPRTALVSETSVVYQLYPNRDDATANLLANNVRIATSIGVNGVITQRLSVTASVGYASGFYQQNTDDFEAVTARLEGRFRLAETFQLGLGYSRSVNPSYIGNFQRADSIYASMGMLARGRFLMTSRLVATFAETGRAFRGDDPSLLVGNRLRRKDVRLTAELNGEYRFTDWLAATATLGFLGNFTDYEYNLPMTGGVILPDPSASYQRVEAWLGVRAFY